MTTEEVAAFRRLVSQGRGALRARQQSVRGEYDGETFEVTDEHLHAHFEGSMTLGFVCAENGRSRFLAIELDERFGLKLPYIAQILERRHFDAAAMVTSGSGPGRGKNLYFLPGATPSLRCSNSREKYTSKRVNSVDGAPSKRRRPSTTDPPLGKEGSFASEAAIASHREKQRPATSSCLPTESRAHLPTWFLSWVFGRSAKRGASNHDSLVGRERSSTTVSTSTRVRTFSIAACCDLP